ncbi:SE2200 family small protein [Staphylococcus lloydii]|nr:SE2200 family small protein [Staphylococcus lloydii]MDU9418734.1 SE2200 family small protein [Staphylococcus lloydii]
MFQGRKGWLVSEKYKSISSFSNWYFSFCALKRYQQHVNKTPNIDY